MNQNLRIMYYLQLIHFFKLVSLKICKMKTSVTRKIIDDHPGNKILGKKSILKSDQQLLFAFVKRGGGQS